MSAKTSNTVEDRDLAKRIMKQIDKIEQLNDAVGNTPIRHAISEYLVRIRLLARDGHERNINGGLKP